MKSHRSRPGQGQGFNPLAFGIAIGGSFSASDSLFSDVFGGFFPFVKLLFEEVSPVPQGLRNIDSWARLHLPVNMISNA